MAKLKIEGVEHDADLNELTYGEAEEIENVLGLSFGEWGDALTKGKMSAVKALVLVILKRHNPNATLNDVNNLPLNAVEFIPDPPKAEVKHAGRVTKKAENPTEKASA